MDIPTDTEIRDFEALEALYIATGKGQKDVGPREALKDIFDERDDRIRWARHMEQRGLVEFDGSMVPKVKLSREGSQRVETGIEHRQNRAVRRELARRRLLAWTDQNSSGRHDLVNAESFTDSRHGWVHGVRLDFEELLAAADYLHDKELIVRKTLSAWGGPVRVDVSITDEGRACLDEFDGDIGAHNKSKETPMAGPTFNFGNVTGSSFAVAGDHSKASAVATNNDLDNAALLGETVRQVLSTLNLSPAELSQAEEHITALEAKTDQGKVRAALHWIVDFSNSSASGAAGQLLGGLAASLLGAQT